MSQITITDEAILAQLDSGNGTITVRDKEGKVRGFFTPLRPSDLQPRISEEEIHRRIAAGGGRKLADILRDLESRK
jgi:hypothetical protein